MSHATRPWNGRDPSSKCDLEGHFPKATARLFEVALAHLSNRLDLQKDLCAQILDHSERRPARVLPELTRIGVEQREPVVLPKISHETLASIVGTPRSRITYFMNCFRKRGLIDYKGGAMVRPSRLNVALQDE